jgi:hypothetical protein
MVSRTGSWDTLIQWLQNVLVFERCMFIDEVKNIDCKAHQVIHAVWISGRSGACRKAKLRKCIPDAFMRRIEWAKSGHDVTSFNATL